MLDSPLDGIRSPFGVRRGRAFSPSTLFALAEPGVWFDPSDTSTLYQDPAGTTPVTAPGNTVGLMLDKSKGLALGAELVANGDFASGTGWEPMTGWAITGGKAAATAAASGAVVTQTVSISSGRFYKVQYTISDFSSGSFALKVGGTLSTVRSANGSYVEFIVAGAGTLVELQTRSVGGSTLSIDNISVRELAGNHATQATLVARPTYSIEPVGGRRNLLTWSEDLTNGAWTTIGGTTKNSALNFTFTAATSRLYQSFSLISGATYTISTRFSDADVGKKIRPAFFDSSAGWLLLADTTIPVGGVVTRTITMTNAGSFVGFQAASDLSANTSFTLVSGQSVQLELGSTATAYQRVTTQHDVTEGGVASVGYLYFDGVNDAMATSTITPGIDKAQVFAGVRKLDAAGPDVVVELSANSFSNDGSLALFAPYSGSLYEVFTRGTVTYAWQKQGTYAAPITNVVQASLDNSKTTTATQIVARVDGSTPSVVTNQAGPTGAGNYLAYPLYLGGRAGTSLFYSGHLYSLITRFGPTLDAPTIASTETWVAGKTGFYTPIITGVPTIGVS